MHRLKLDLQCDGTRRCGPCREARFRRGHEATRMSALPVTGEEGRPALPPHAGRTPGGRLSASQGETPPQHLARRLPASSAVRRNCPSRLPRSVVRCDSRSDGPRSRACSGNPGAPLRQSPLLSTAASRGSASSLGSVSKPARGSHHTA